MWLEGGECEFSNATKQQVAINFYCDKYHGLGKPIKSYTSTCQANFNWPSIAACTDKGIVRPQLSKCYVYDEKGNERDLSPLIHETGYEVVASSHSLAQFAHLATHLDKRELNVPESRINSGFYINVCSEVKHLCNTGPSDSGNMACYRNGSKVLALGDMRKTTIDYDDKSDEVVLRSSAPSVKTDDCPDGLKSVIRFKCPHHSTGEIDSYSALGSRRPFVVSTSTCEVIIEWETDYACPTQALEGNYQTCIIRDESTQRQIDLSPLKAKGFQRLSKLSINFDEFSIHPTDADDEIVLKVCNSFNITEPIHTTHCGEDWSGSSVCLRSTSEAGNSSTNSVIGSMKDAKFRYADGLVSLRYPTRKGHCVSPHLAEYVSEADGPSTLITFPCNESAGFGSPVFAGYDDCVYRIEWPTNLTCHKQDLSYSYRLMTPCTVFHKGSLYDLSLLRKSHDQLAWQASVANSALAKDQSLAKKLILLNVCSKVTKLSKLEKNITTKSLPENAAVILHSHNESKSLGRDISSPEWDEKSGGLVLRYIDNISTSSGPVMVRSTIKFGCTPGKLDSSPQLVKVSKDGKIESYEFFWPTAAACPIHEHKGNNCQVTVPNLATVIDLNPLVTDELFSHVTEDDRGYKYYINICGSLGNSPCKSKTNSSLAGICQFQKSSNRTWILGQANRNLTYWNGVLSLRYTDGDKYNDPNKTPRSAELSFVCSDDESLEMIYEANRTYFFRYYTKHACPNVINMVPCLWSNGTHSVDLGRISITQDQNHFAAKTATKSSEGSVVAFLNICRPLNPFIPADMNCRQGSAACKLIYSGNGSTKALSLGIPRFPPVLHDDQLALIYPNGDPCPKNSSILLSSKLLFICDPSAFEPVIEIATTKDDECIEVFHVKTNETCEVFPPRPQDKGLSLENRNVRPNKQEAGSSKQFISGSLVFLLFAVTLIIISVLAVMAFPNSRLVIHDSSLRATLLLQFVNFSTTLFTLQVGGHYTRTGLGLWSNYLQQSNSLFTGSHGLSLAAGSSERGSVTSIF